ncbi:MAG TPA: sulfotransferase [Nannocystis exedens]|nr:sulfotransferase [Nannocystis exedens]
MDAASTPSTPTRARSSTGVRLPFLIRVLNGLGRVADRVGIRPRLPDLDRAVAQAQSRIGLSDLGHPSFREHFGGFIDAFCREAKPTLTGHLGVLQEVDRVVEQRLHLVEAIRRDPIRAAGPTRPPVFILGFPRTGTTLLHNLLAGHPSLRAPMMWEIHTPMPLGPGAVDRRRELGETLIQHSRFVLPEMQAIHPMHADWPDECFWLFALTGLSIQFEVRYDVPSWRGTLLSADWGPPVEAYAAMLGLLEDGSERTWLLKAPSHLFRLRALLRRFPNARWIWNHRDPNAFVASCSSLYEHPRTLENRNVDASKLGHAWFDLWGRALEGAIEARDAVGQERFFDLSFADLIGDPVATVGALETWLGLPPDPASASRVRAWLREHPRDRQGVHRYGLGHYGLDEATVLRRMGPYMDRFGEYARAKIRP